MEPASLRRKEYLALRTKLTARTEEQLVIPFSSMLPDQRDLVRDIEIKQLVNEGKVAGVQTYNRSCSRFVGQTSKYSVDGEWFSSAPNPSEEEPAELRQEHRKLMSLWHGRNWTKTLMTRSDARDKDGLALLSYAKFEILIRPGRMKSKLKDRQMPDITPLSTSLESRPETNAKKRFSHTIVHNTQYIILGDENHPSKQDPVSNT